MAFKPTKAQQYAIYKKGNILVSAAAGSGKTAVLVERVINLLCNKENPVRADMLLILTFTNAAAAEMRSRIENRIDEELRNNPNDTGLLLQKHLLANAKICTIDSFCIDLVRENFDKLGISPDFKIGENSALQEINERVISSIINRYFEEKNHAFLELLDIIGAEFDEKNFANLILSVYEYSRQLPAPQKWYDSLLDNYQNGSFSKDNIWYKYAFNNALTVVEGMESLIANGIELLINSEEAINAYGAVFYDARDKILGLKEAVLSGEWDVLYRAICDYKLLRMPSVRGLSALSEVAATKDIYKYLGGKALEKLEKFFYADFSFIDSQFKKLYPSLALFVDILKEYAQKVFEEYKENNIFTFHNTEHLALKLLCNQDGTPTEYSKEIISQYEEILVDEYQDTNDLQNTLFRILSNFDENLFVVGDVKQSIYAFRGANPENFLSKKNSYIPIDKANSTDPKKIILGNNFRSKDEICDFANYFFSLFMTKQTGNITYEKEDELIASAVFPQTNENAVSIDMLDVSECTESSIVLESRRIAQIIKSTIEGEQYIKKDDKTLRKADYGDFAILLRNLATKGPALVEELKKQGIPVSLNMSDLTQRTEILTVLSLLRVIDNPQNDIELLTLLLSPIFLFTENELATLRAQKKDGNLYSAIIFAAKNGNEHCKEFLSKLEAYRFDSVTLPLTKFLSKLLITTEYLNIVSCLPDGEQRRNNLLLLCDYAKQFETDKIPSLSDFLRYIVRQIESTPASNSSSDNAVKIMTIHASKGLQFPICILVATSSKFNDAESRSAAAYSTKYGLGLKYFDEDDKQKYTTISREVILSDIKQTSLEEELRLFYVAMTRAQDKLHFISTFKNIEKTVEGYKNLILSSQGEIDYTLFSRTKSYADWLALSVILHPDGKKLKSQADAILPLATSSKFDLNIINAASLHKAQNSEISTDNKPDLSLTNEMLKNFEYSYPFEDLKNLRSKMSVSLLANKAESEKFNFTAKPSFLSKSGASATARGTAMHKVMEFFDFSKSSDIEAEIERLYEWQFISEDEKNSLNLKALKEFFESDIFKRIKRSEVVEREMRFLTEVGATEIDPTLSKTYQNEKVVIQGAVDVCFIEDDEIVILDFKTDRVEDIGDLAKAYGEQLSIYALACQKIFGKKVKEKIIYSFHKSNTVAIK